MCNVWGCVCLGVGVSIPADTTRSGDAANNAGVVRGVQSKTLPESPELGD